MARKTLAQRFEEQVERAGEHHLWTGAKNATRGTGRTWVGTKDATTHRVAWELAHGPLAADARVHACPDEPACVRIEHLTVGATSRSSLCPFVQRRVALREAPVRSVSCVPVGGS